MDLLRIGGVILIASAIFAWLNIWVISRRNIDTATVSVKVTILALSMIVGSLVFLIGLLTQIF